MKASNIANNSTQTLCNSIRQNSFGSFQCARHCVGCTTAGRDLVLKKPTIRKPGEPHEVWLSLHSPAGGYVRCEEGVCSGISWHMRLVWTAVQCGLSELSKYKRSPSPACILMLHSVLPPPSLTIALFLSPLFLSSTYFSFFTIFSPFLPCVNHRRKV